MISYQEFIDSFELIPAYRVVNLIRTSRQQCVSPSIP